MGTPLKIDLVPTHGNPDLEITIISNLTVSKSVWQALASTPTFTSESRYGQESVMLDPRTNQKFKESCGQWCIVLIAVIESQTYAQEEGTDSHYTIQASRGFTELVEGRATVGKVEQSKDDLGSYDFYKFYKACDLQCDLIVNIKPTTIGTVMAVLINYQDK